MPFPIHEGRTPVPVYEKNAPLAIITNPGDVLDVAITALVDWGVEVARGNTAGMRVFTIPGRKNSISTTVLDDITQVPATTVLPDPGGIQMEVVSSSANDAAAGTGAQSVDIHYLDSVGVEQEETVTMDGLTPVNTVGLDFDKIQWMHTKTVGANVNGVAVGNISLRDTTGATTYEYIGAGGNQSLSCRYHVPTGYTGFILGWDASGITKEVDLRLRATVERFDRTLVPGVFLFQDAIVLNDATSGWQPFKVPPLIPAGATVKISGISAAAGGDAGASFDVLLIAD
jgi:hypothetical protein